MDPDDDIHQPRHAARDEVVRLRKLVQKLRNDKATLAADLERLTRELARHRTEIDQLTRQEVVAQAAAASAPPGPHPPNPVRQQQAATEPASWAAQASTVTFAGRYDRIFDKLPRHVPPHAVQGRPLRLLSFGCSSGAELADLRRLYPAAKLLGCDVNRAALAQARVAGAQIGARVFRSSAEAVVAHRPFDLITAMSVLTRFPAVHDLPDISQIFPFPQFETMVGILTDTLAIGGVLAVYNSTYSVADTASAPRLDAIAPDGDMQNGWIDKYDRDGRRLTRCVGFVDGQLSEAPGWRRGPETFDYRHIACTNAPLPDTRTVFWRRLR